LSLFNTDMNKCTSDYCKELKAKKQRRTTKEEFNKRKEDELLKSRGEGLYDSELLDKE
jgi:hypothetical protein